MFSIKVSLYVSFNLLTILYYPKGINHFLSYLFQKHTIPITTRIASSMKCFVSSKSANVNNANDDYKGVSENDLEMGYRPSKADKTLVDDAEAEVPHNRSTKITRMEKNASNIDRVSRVLFPLVFLVFNLFYWTFFNGHVVKQKSHM